MKRGGTWRLPTVRAAVVVVAAFVAAGTFVSPAWATSASSTTTTVPQTDAAGTVWLCRPGLAHDPCAGNLSTTSITADNQRTVTDETAAGDNKRFNCFYLYPTASPELTINSDLTVQPAETAYATSQTAPFSQDCNVWAPMYRQITVHGLLSGQAGAAAGAIAYASVLSDWNDFIKNYDNGRPIIFIGHSQGSVMLIKLLEAEVDPNPALRDLVVSAIIAGGNVTVPTGKTVGVTFQHLPLCTRLLQSGCVIAYSSFPSQPPANSMFGRPGQGISLDSGQTATTGVQVACVDPAALGGGTAELSPLFTLAAVPPLPAQALPAPTVATPWVAYPDMYSATCESADGATWLQVTHNAAAGDVRPLPVEFFGPSWGYHLSDINLTLGNLVKDVRAEESAYDLHDRR
jgi:hypothetical protein